MIPKSGKIYIAGHGGLVGSALVRKYLNEGYKKLILKTRKELDLTNQVDVFNFFKTYQPEYVIIAAARVGGILPNMTYPADFMYETVQIQNNILWAALRHKVKKLLYISCGCAYPTKAKQPIKEEYLLTGVPEKTNEGFALAKISGIKLAEKIFVQYKRTFISCIPTNSYGFGDHFGPERSHVIPALIKRFYNSRLNNDSSVTLWGTGSARREFLYVDDLAEALFLLMNSYSEPECINVGSGETVSIKELSQIIKEVVGYTGKILFDRTKPDGMKIRMLDSSKIKKMGFKPSVSLREGIKKTFDYYLSIVKKEHEKL